MTNTERAELIQNAIRDYKAARESGQQSRKEDYEMKRYRDDAGRLTTTIDQIAQLTSKEATAYYHSGAVYSYQGREYTYNPEEGRFQSFGGYSLFVDPARLGTFLPDVASAGEEIRLVEDLREEAASV